MESQQYDVIIIGGSYSGLSAGMALGRSLRKVLIIDSGKPCNRQTPHSHNFITQDGRTPLQIHDAAKEQVLKYHTVTYMDGLVTAVVGENRNFKVTVDNGEILTAKKLVFATGIADDMPGIDGFSPCWGISALYCPYCHGYEVVGKTIGIVANGDLAYSYCKLYSNWTNDLVLFTNGKSTLTVEQAAKLAQHNIKVIEAKVTAIKHTNGYMHTIILEDGYTQKIDALYLKIEVKQHCPIPQYLGCRVNDHGYLIVDENNKTTVEGIYAAGDNSTQFRSVASAVGSGNRAGICINNCLVYEEF